MQPVTLPPYHVPTKYPGYFYNVQDHKLYSYKMKQELRPLKKYYPNPFNRLHMPGFYISDNGRRKFVPVSYLRSLNIFNIIDNPPVRNRRRKK